MLARVLTPVDPLFLPAGGEAGDSLGGDSLGGGAVPPEVDMEVAGAESAVFAETKDEAEASMQSLSGKVDYDKLWYIHGQAYDLQANGWLNRHPGGYGLALIGNRHLSDEAVCFELCGDTSRPSGH